MNSIFSGSMVHGLCASLLLAGCATTRPAAVDSAQVAAQYGRGASAANQPAVKVDPVDAQATSTGDRWWSAYEDAQLDQLIDEVLAKNQDLVAAGLRLRRAWIDAGIMQDAQLPQLSGSASVSRSRELSGDDSWQKSAAAGVNLEFQADLWGKLRAQHSAAEWEARATAEDLAATRLALVGTAGSLYWQLGYLNQRIAAGAASIERLERTLTLVRVQYDAGAVSRLELLEAQQSLDTSRQQQSSFLQQQVEARNSLTVLRDGEPWPAAMELQGLEERVVPAAREGLPAELLARRPDLRASVDRLRGALSDQRATSAGYFPQFSLTAALNTASEALADVLKNPVATLGAGLTLPFLQVNRLRLDRAASRVAVELAVTDFRTALYTAFTEVDNALSNAAQLQAQREAAQRSFDAAVEVERLYEVRYRAGATTLRNWLDAQETRRSAELSLAQVRLDALTNSATLFQALGG